MAIHLTLLDVCNALFALRAFPSIVTLSRHATWRDIRNAMLGCTKRAVIVQNTLYCVVRNPAVYISASYGVTRVHSFPGRHRHVVGEWTQDDMCRIAFVFYTLSTNEWIKYDALEDPTTEWQQKLSAPILNLVQNTPLCSQLAVHKDGRKGYLFENNYHKSYHPMHMKLLNGHQISVRLPFSAMTWAAVFKRVKELLTLHYLALPNVVQDIYSQISAMEIGYLGFVLADGTESVDTFGPDQGPGHRGDLVIDYRQIAWNNPEGFMETLLPQSICLLVWDYVFQTEYHKSRIRTVFPKRCKIPVKNSEWKPPVRLFAYPVKNTREYVPSPAGDTPSHYYKARPTQPHSPVPRVLAEQVIRCVDASYSSSCSQLQICLVCLEENVEEEMLSCSQKMDHNICKQCLCTWLKLQMPHADVAMCTKITHHKCDGEFNIFGLQSRLPCMWVTKYQLQKTAQNKGVLFACPNCSYDCLMEFKELANQDESQCPICNTVICTLCFARGHANITCVQAKTLQHVELVEGTLRCGHCHVPGAIEKNTCLKSTCSGCFGITCACCGKALSKSKTCINEDELYNQHYCRALPTDAVPANGTCNHKKGEKHCWLWNSSEEASNVDRNFAMRHPHLIPGKKTKPEMGNLISINVWFLTRTKAIRCNVVKVIVDLDDPDLPVERIAAACEIDARDKNYILCERGYYEKATPVLVRDLFFKNLKHNNTYYFTEDTPPKHSLRVHFHGCSSRELEFNVDPTWSLVKFERIIRLRTGYQHPMAVYFGEWKLTYQDNLEVSLSLAGVSFLSKIPILLTIRDL